jgi:seryl-tRNA synthetase
MIDVAAMRDDQQLVKRLKLKDPNYPVDRLLQLDGQRLSLITSIEQLRARKNELAKTAHAGVTDQVRSESMALSEQLKKQEAELEVITGEFKTLYLHCPNIPEASLPVGGKEANKSVEQWGTKPTFDFTPLNHIDLGKKNAWFDFEAAARMSGSGFVLYKGDAVKLIYALTHLMLRNNRQHGFEPLLPPYLINEKALETASNFPRFKQDVYAIKDEDLFLTPTAEVNLTNMYRDMILNAEQLPVRMTAWTSCFRREAGGYGAHERGLIRIHEFEKVELYSIVKPEDSMQELEHMCACAQKILQQLGLHYRVSLLATQDCSFASAKTYDLEVWMPGQQAYYEVSSCSNCTDFQARRGGIRWRRSATAKPELVHTLNASSLALPRLMVALMETYQQKDGSIVLPPALAMYMDW